MSKVSLQTSKTCLSKCEDDVEMLMV